MTDAAAFVVAWLKVHDNKGSIDNVATELGVEVASVKTRAKQWYNRKGDKQIALPPLKDYDPSNKVKGRKLDAVNLNDMIKNALTEQQKLIQQMTEAPANVVIMEGQSLVRTEEAPVHMQNIAQSA